MASKQQYTFSTVKGCEDLQWFNPPASVNPGANGESGLKVFMAKTSDFWQKTYYNPPLTNDNGHLLYKEIGSNVLMETTFHLSAKSKFDQAGLMVYKNTGTWIKTGLEEVDGTHRLSVVVTNEYSDWSTQAHVSGDLSVRIYRLGASFVIEAKSANFGDWDFIRICHLNIGENEPIKAGLLACAPIAAGGSAVFDYLSYEECKDYHHKSM